MIPSPSQQRRRLSSRAALLVATSVFGALLLPAPAGAVLLWKRGDRTGEGSAAAASAEAPRQETSSPLAGGSNALAEAAAAALDAPETLPGPQEVANYNHELRLLSVSYADLKSSGPGRERALALLAYGNDLARLTRDGPAARAFAEAIEFDGSLQAAWNNLGSLLRRRGHLELANSVFRSVLADDPEAGLAWFNLAMGLDELRDWDGSDEAYVMALTYSPELWVATKNPLIVGNRRAQQALHRRYLASHGRGSIYLDDAR